MKLDMHNVRIDTTITNEKIYKIPLKFWNTKDKLKIKNEMNMGE